MSNQEPNPFSDQQHGEDTNFGSDELSFHHLTSAGAGDPQDNSKKRQFLSSSSSQESCKRHFCPSAAGVDGNGGTDPFLGFTTLPLPVSFPSSHSLPLRRTISEPVQFYGEILKPSSKEGLVIDKRQMGSSVIHRTVSDPSSVANFNPSKAYTPPRPPARKASEESPDARRLKRMKERLREMNQWWNHVMSEGEEDQEDDCENIIHKDECETEMERPSEEAVWVEQNGKSLVLHFKCPCGNGYQVLLNGNNCYYKLTSF